MQLSVTCECGTEYDLNYAEHQDGEISFDACPDCGVQLASETVLEAVNADGDESEQLY
ncbi:hypothetical protein [Herpetosiphon llansteffanensis]|uniref:hypothetical protein n=1 Tax=Herpetosiphon llansteffanensis TaxID=2094568 RepID=UPI0013DFDE11|nr:hypothetical protein [Herpetosiphon llansteffanensis]